MALIYTLMSLSLTSCSDDDDEPGGNIELTKGMILGSWHFVYDKDYVRENGVNYIPDTYHREFVISFLGDNTAIVECRSDNYYGTSEGTYFIEGNSVFLSSDIYADELEFISLNDGKAVVDWHFTYSDVSRYNATH